ncbi:hypothetical protein IWQ60_009687 [Tieghemiomyces parasiticus]|uniref:PAP-associated domain-containing protein n=1 Tax=Tieghemiomyces parasiticus TaxID=78921 RepID=A0A9W7ZND1_9FUNG|nr:hypothetical protein IWQ60_009687 [Tieghemiomyces parasiticus]
MARFPHASAFALAWRRRASYRATDQAQLRVVQYMYDLIRREGNRPVRLGYLHRAIQNDSAVEPYLPRTGVYPLLLKPAFRPYFHVKDEDFSHMPPNVQALTPEPLPPSPYASPCLDEPNPPPVESIVLEPIRWVTTTDTSPAAEPPAFDQYNRGMVPLPRLETDPVDRDLPFDPDQWATYLARVSLTTGCLAEHAYRYTRRQEYLVNQQLLLRYFTLTPDPTRLTLVNQATNHARQAFISFFPDVDYRVELVGSFVSELATANSDINLSLILPQRRILKPELSAEEQMAVWATFTSVFRGCGLKTIRLNPGPDGVPVVDANYGKHKAYVPVKLIPDDPIPYYETHLLKAYGDFDPRVRPLAQTLLHWADQRQLRLPRVHIHGESMPTLLRTPPLLMMLIGFLQYRGILPSLQRIDACVHQRPGDLDATLRQASQRQADHLARLRAHEARLNVTANSAPAEGAPPALDLLTFTTADLTTPDLRALYTDLQHCQSCGTELPSIPLGSREGYFLRQPPPAYENHRAQVKRRAVQFFDNQARQFVERDRARFERDQVRFLEVMAENPRTRLNPPTRHTLTRQYWHYPQLMTDNGYTVPYMAVVPQSFAERCGLRLHVSDDEYVYDNYHAGEELFSQNPEPLHRENWRMRPQIYSYRPVLDHTSPADPDPRVNVAERDPHDATLAQLLLEFFRFYGHEFPYTQAMVSVRLGGIFPRSLAPASAIRSPVPARLVDYESRYHLLAIEHPFQIETNMGEGLRPWTVEGLAWECRRAFDILQTVADKPSTTFDASALLDRLHAPYDLGYFTPDLIRAYRLSGRFWRQQRPSLLDPTAPPVHLGAPTGGATATAAGASTDELDPTDVNNDPYAQTGEPRPLARLRRYPDGCPGDPNPDPVNTNFKVERDDVLLAEHKIEHFDEYELETMRDPEFRDLAEHIIKYRGGKNRNYPDGKLGITFHSRLPFGQRLNNDDPFVVPATVEVPYEQATVDILLTDEDELLGYELAADAIFRQVAREEGDMIVPLTDEEKARLKANPHLDPHFPPDSPFASNDWPDPEGEKVFLKEQGYPDRSHLERSPRRSYRQFVKSGRVVAKSWG